MRTLTLAAFLLFALANAGCLAPTRSYTDPSAPVDARVADLLSRMTLEEKCAQLWQHDPDGLEVQDGKVSEEALAKLIGDRGFCSMTDRVGGTVQEQLALNRAAVEYSRKKTRLGVPIFMQHEALHGIPSVGATIYPQTIAQGATFNPALIHEMGQQIADEATAIGVSLCLAPLADMARDPRWGRVEETYGECPYLTSRMVTAYITGMQGPDPWSGVDSNHVICCVKHFVGYCKPATGINCAPASIGQRELRSVFLPPFKSAIREARVFAVMPSYHAVDGIPSHANRWLLQTILRDEWGFQGFVYSDWGALPLLNQGHHITATHEDSAVVALAAGVDVEANGPACYQHLAKLVHERRIPEKQIDQAAARVLRAKFIAGLFDDRRIPVADDEIGSRVHTPAHVALARKVAEESVVLLKNKDNLLPLDTSKLKSVAVIGPLADQVQFGDYTPTRENQFGVTVLGGLRDVLKDSGVTIRHAKGCPLVMQKRDGFAEALDAAKQSDVSIVVVGDSSQVYGQGIPGEFERYKDEPPTVGEGFDVSDLTLPGVQEDLIRAVHAAGKPMIVVMITGRPYSSPFAKHNASAVLQAFFPGEQGGRAIADILFGRVNPSGRLPVTIPQSAGHLPCTYDAPTGAAGFWAPGGSVEKPGGAYALSTTAPLWSFGHGLTYTTFAYSDLSILTPRGTRDDTIRVQYRLTNTGPRDGSEVVQMYQRPLVSSTVTPNRRLIRFDKVALRTGESRVITFEFTTSELAIWNTDMHQVVEPGKYELMIGASATDTPLTANFELAPASGAPR